MNPFVWRRLRLHRLAWRWKTTGPHAFSTTQVELPRAISDRLLALGAAIPDDHLAADGRETVAHVTVRYGLHADSAEAIRPIVAAMAPFPITFGKTSLFETDTHDVVKVDVRGDGLHALHAALGAVEHTDTHPVYHPHATIAYVRSGLGDQYAEDASLDGVTTLCGFVTFRSKDGTQTTLPLLGGAWKYSDDEPRDDHGMWTSGGGGDSSLGNETGGGHVWSQPMGADGRPIPIPTKSVEEAIPLVLAGKVVELPDVKSAATLLDDMAQFAQAAKAQGKDAPNFNLCNVSVHGTNLFCGQELRDASHPNGYPRVDMPQLGGVPRPGTPAAALPRTPWNPNEVDGGAQFIGHLQSLGIKVTDGTEDPANLHASQRELVGPKVAAMMQGKIDPHNPLFITKDNYIVDGHHRWAALVGQEAETGKLGGLKVNVHRIDAPISEVLHLANDWSKKFGIMQSDASGGHKSAGCGCGAKRKYDDSEPRDDAGRWTDGGGAEPSDGGSGSTDAHLAAATGLRSLEGVDMQSWAPVRPLATASQWTDSHPDVQSALAGMKEGVSIARGDVPGVDLRVGYMNNDAGFGEAVTATKPFGSQAITLINTRESPSAVLDKAIHAETGPYPNTVSGRIAADIARAAMATGDPEKARAARAEAQRELYRGIMIHEIGHVLDLANTPTGKRPDEGLGATIHKIAIENNHGSGSLADTEWRALWTRSHISDYAWNGGPKEAFAEAYAAYKLGRLDPALKSFMEGVLNKRRTGGGKAIDELPHDLQMWMRRQPTDVIEVPEPAKAVKYSDDEPRDDHGEWTSGGDSGGSVPANARGGWSEGQGTPAASIAHAETTLSSPALNVEHGILIDHKTGKTLTIGDDAATSIRILADNPMRQDGNDITFVHNHPAGTSLSPDDIGVLATAKGTRALEAVTSDGGRYTAARTDKTVWPAIGNEENDAYQAVFEAVNPMVIGGAVNQRDASVLHMHALNAALDSAGLIKYSFTLGGSLRHAMERNPGLFEKMRATAYDALMRWHRSGATAAITPFGDGDWTIDDTPPAYGDAAKAVKYSPDQPRDDHGMWTDGGGGASADAATGVGHHPDFAAFAQRLSKPDGGFTVNTITGQEPHGPGNYIVSIYPKASTPVDPTSLKASDLSQYVLAHRDLLSRPGHYFGGWHDPSAGGQIWLDTSVVVHDRAHAERLAKAHNQISYFDLGAGKSVNVGGTGEAPSDDHKGATQPAGHERVQEQAVLRTGDPASAQVADREGRDAGGRGTGGSGRGSVLSPDWRVNQRHWRAALKADLPILARADDEAALRFAETPLYETSWPEPVKAAARQEPTFARALRQAWAQAADALDVAAVARALRTDDQPALLRALEATRLNDLTKHAAHPLIATAFLNGVKQGKPALRRIGVQVRALKDGPSAFGDLSGFNLQAVIWADEHAAELLIGSDDQKEIVRLLTEEAETGTATVDDLARAIKTVVGLTPQAVQAVTSLGATLFDQGLDAAEVMDQMEAYAEAKLNQRAMLIARTETMAATNGGQIALWDDAVSNGLIDAGSMQKEWIVTDDGNVCDICESLGESDPVDIDENFDGDYDAPPAHPACRCTVGLVRVSDADKAPTPKVRRRKILRNAKGEIVGWEDDHG